MWFIKYLFFYESLEWKVKIFVSSSAAKHSISLYTPCWMWVTYELRKKKSLAYNCVSYKIKCSIEFCKIYTSIYVFTCHAAKIWIGNFLLNKYNNDYDYKY